MSGVSMGVRDRADRSQHTGTYRALTLMKSHPRRLSPVTFATERVDSEE